MFVVDDEQVIASTLAAILQLDGLDARFFFDPLAALQEARTTPPDLLISDVVMPGLSGVDLAIRMTEQRPDCKVLLFSGQAATADLLKTAQLQGYDFELISKPIHPTEMLARVRQMNPCGVIPEVGQTPSNLSGF